MNILFIEDEKELSVLGVGQLQLKGYTVYPAFDIAESQAILDDPKIEIDLIISDHRLPDGLGIPFLIEKKEAKPNLKCAVVSGCLTKDDEKQLEDAKIPYFHKPLLYSHVVDEVRKSFALRAPVHVEPVEPAPESDKEEKAKPKKKLFGFWPLN